MADHSNGTPRGRAGSSAPSSSCSHNQQCRARSAPRGLPPSCAQRREIADTNTNRICGHKQPAGRPAAMEACSKPAKQLTETWCSHSAWLPAIKLRAGHSHCF